MTGYAEFLATKEPRDAPSGMSGALEGRRDAVDVLFDAAQ